MDNLLQVHHTIFSGLTNLFIHHQGERNRTRALMSENYILLPNILSHILFNFSIAGQRLTPVNETQFMTTWLYGNMNNRSTGSQLRRVCLPWPISTIRLPYVTISIHHKNSTSVTLLEPRSFITPPPLQLVCQCLQTCTIISKRSSSWWRTWISFCL